MKITIDFETAGKETEIPYEKKLLIIKKIIRAAHNPVEFVTVEIKAFTTSDKA